MKRTIMTGKESKSKHDMQKSLELLEKVKKQYAIYLEINSLTSLAKKKKREDQYHPPSVENPLNTHRIKLKK